MPITTYPDPTNATNVVTTMQYANQVTGQAFMPVIVFTVWLVLFITLKAWRTEAALSSSLFATMMITILLRTANLVTDVVLVVVVIAFLASFFMTVLSREEGG